MPLLKPIAGHTGTATIRKYLEKNGRALARDLMNLPVQDWISETGRDIDLSVAWDEEMDSTRHAFENDTPWKGRDARTFKHFILSPDPDDAIDLDTLRELSKAWAERFFGEHEVAIVYHDDNQGSIPHAHIVVNNTNLETGYRMHTEHPEDLNRALQDMAREMGLSGFSNDIAPARGSKKLSPRSRQAVYFGRAEKGILRDGGYSWVADIRARVALAKNTSRSQEEFFDALSRLGIEVSDNSAKARRVDWIFSLADEPSKRVSGERLGYTFGKSMLTDRFQRQAAYRPSARSASEIRHRAVDALRLNDLGDLSRLSAVLETCAKFDIRYLEDFDSRLATLTRRGNEDSEGFRRLVAARIYVADNELMTRRAPRGDLQPVATRRRGSSAEQPRQRVQEQQRTRARERGER